MTVGGTPKHQAFDEVACMRSPCQPSSIAKGTGPAGLRSPRARGADPVSTTAIYGGGAEVEYGCEPKPGPDPCHISTDATQRLRVPRRWLAFGHHRWQPHHSQRTASRLHAAKAVLGARRCSYSRFRALNAGPWRTGSNSAQPRNAAVAFAPAGFESPPVSPAGIRPPYGFSQISTGRYRTPRPGIHQGVRGCGVSPSVAAAWSRGTRPRDHYRRHRLAGRVTGLRIDAVVFRGRHVTWH